MSEKYKPVKGDRVRVVFEGEVVKIYSDGDLAIQGVKNYKSDLPAEGIISIEKVEPPVTVFKPGDVVRDKTNPRWKYAIGKKGYTQLSDGSYFEDGEPFIQNEFTSKDYELVSLG